MNTQLLSNTAKNLIPSGIRKISEIVNERIDAGEKIFNLTIGDFSPKVFPIPTLLKDEIKRAYDESLTNYPPVMGALSLRKAVSEYLKTRGGFEYSENEILIGSGARPLTYTLLLTLVNPGEKVIYPAPSWNNNCYIQLIGAQPVPIKTTAENNFMCTADDIRPHLCDAALLALNSPLNPSGTVFDKDVLKKILDDIVDENRKRAKENRKPLYIFYDMIYWILVYGNTKHYNPLELTPEIKDYIIFIDGISKCFAATGVRLGWVFGPCAIIKKMSSILAHIGAWSPKPEQVATGRFLENKEEVDKFFSAFKNELFERLNIFYEGIIKIKNSGFDVDAIYPQAALYLTVKLNLIGKKTTSGRVLEDIDDVLEYILEEAKIAIVPFYAFGSDRNIMWFRLSVGTCSVDEANQAVKQLENAVNNLK